MNWHNGIWIPAEMPYDKQVNQPNLMSLEITNQVRIQNHPDYWYTAEDTYLSVGGEGFTISYWQDENGQEKRVDHICMNEEEALAVADAIYKFFKK